MKKYSVLFIIISTINQCIAQTNFKELNDQLFCNAFTFGKADSATADFLKIHFPYLTEKLPKGQVIGIPIGRDAKRGIETMKFEKHPFFTFNTIQCRINFQTVQKPGFQKPDEAAK